MGLPCTTVLRGGLPFEICILTFLVLDKRNYSFTVRCSGSVTFSDGSGYLKGLCHEMNIFDEYFCTCADSFYNFLFLTWCKNQTQSFSLLLWNYLLIMKILPVTRLKDPEATTLKILIGSSLWLCKIILEAAFEKWILAHFPCMQWEVYTREHWPITDKWILRRVSLNIFKISK
jgi:hypothetical protein